jgi:hypothetical protein
MFVETMAPKTLVPVHTESPEDFEKIFSKQDKITDGVPLVI